MIALIFSAWIGSMVVEWMGSSSNEPTLLVHAAELSQIEEGIRQTNLWLEAGHEIPEAGLLLGEMTSSVQRPQQFHAEAEVFKVYAVKEGWLMTTPFKWLPDSREGLMEGVLKLRSDLPESRGALACYKIGVWVPKEDQQEEKVWVNLLGEMETNWQPPEQTEVLDRCLWVIF